MQKIAMLRPVPEEMIGVIWELLPEGFKTSAVPGRAPDDVKAAMADADDGVWWDVPVTAEIVAASPKVKSFHKWSVGVDNIDMEACRARCIRVAHATRSGPHRSRKPRMGRSTGSNCHPAVPCISRRHSVLSA